jgi:predicted DNA-binding protein (MmcQ/YjbR family)
MTAQEFKQLALSFPGTESAPHFDRTAFKVIGKRIFTTLHEETGTVNVKLTPAEQSVFCDYDKKVVYPVPNKWGAQGWTTFELKAIAPELMLDALETAYDDVVKAVAKKKRK